MYVCVHVWCGGGGESGCAFAQRCLLQGFLHALLCIRGCSALEGLQGFLHALLCIRLDWGSIRNRVYVCVHVWGGESGCAFAQRCLLQGFIETATHIREARYNEFKCESEVSAVFGAGCQVSNLFVKSVIISFNANFRFPPCLGLVARFPVYL